MQMLSSRQLTQICDTFFLTAEELSPPHNAPLQRRRDYDSYVLAINELWNRGTEIREWARELLTHVDFDAREAGAALLGRLAERGLLGDQEEEIIAELGSLIQRPIEEDMKEMQAVDTAIRALRHIGSSHGIVYFRYILFSTAPEHLGTTQWAAAVELSKLLGETFTASADPVEAAREWLRNHPDA